MKQTAAGLEEHASASRRARAWLIGAGVAVLLIAIFASAWWVLRERGGNQLQGVPAQSQAKEDQAREALGQLHFKLDSNAAGQRVATAPPQLDDESLAKAAPYLSAVSTSQLSLSNTQVTNLDPLKELTGLHTLYLSKTGVTSLDALKGLTGLQTLHVAGDRVTSVDALKGLGRLQALNLSETQVTNLDALKGLTGLQTHTSRELRWRA